MTRLRRLRRSTYAVLVGNVAARFGALGALLLATLIVARQDGPAVVGVYALLHVLPGLLGTIVSCGLTVAVPYFLAGAARDDRRLPLTLVTVALVAGTAGAVLWAAAAPLLVASLFPHLSVPLVAFAGAAVLTRLIVTLAKSCSQGSQDLAGANLVIFTEEAMFLPVYGVLVALGLSGYATVVVGLVLADLVTASLVWGRLIRRGFFSNVSPPSPALARVIAAYGMRAQIGGIITQLNLRLDFIILTVLTGPAVLGVYAIGSKFAELIKIIGMALAYVLYPRFARDGRAVAAAEARRLIPKAGLLTAGVAVPLWIAAGTLIPLFYGPAFLGAVTPARIILLGLVLEGAGGVITAFLYGVGRPGLNSCAMAVGLVGTVALDVLLIPSHGATGAAIASAVAYMGATLALAWFFWRVNRSERIPAELDATALPRAAAQ